MNGILQLNLSSSKMYSVETWDEQFHCTRYHDVTDAIDYEDAEQYIRHLYPNERVLAVIRYLNDKEYD